MVSKLSRFCDGILESGWLVAIISVALFFNIHSERVFEPDKIAILRSIAVIILIAWLVRFIDQSGWREWSKLSWRRENTIWRTPFLLPMLALVVVYLLSTIFSITPRVSWAGSYQRLQGAYTTLAYVAFFVAVVSTIVKREQVNRIPTAAIITSIPVAFYGLLQHFGLDPLPWGGNVIIRVAGHMGNSIFISAFLILIVPLTLARIIDAFTNILTDEAVSYADVTRSAIYIFALAIQLLTIYWSGSRGPLIGLATAMFAFILVLLVSLRNTSGDQERFMPRDVLFAFCVVVPLLLTFILSGIIGSSAPTMSSFILFLLGIALSLGLMLILIVLRKGWKWLWLSWLMLTVLVGGWLLLFNLSDDALSRMADTPVAGRIFVTQQNWKELPTIGSYGKMLDPSQTVGREKSNRVRVLIWEGVVDLVSPHSPLAYPDGITDSFNFWRPIIGYGPESMYVAFNRYYPAELATVEARNASPDRSHNETFDAIVITGVAGLLAWQALYISVFYYGFSYLDVIRSRFDSIMMIGLWIGGALLGALLSLLVFDPIYLGVAIPTGTIVGLVLYLFYYALFAEPVQAGNASDGRRVTAFDTDHLLVNALLATVLAHYVEVHFGIAIVSTRLLFFLFIGLIFVIANRKLRLPKQENPRASKGKRREKARDSASESIWGPVLAWTFLLALLVGTLGASFINYVLPMDKLVETGNDLLAGDIFRQSLFINTQKGFLDSPFIFMMIVISWALGVLIVVSEMIRERVFQIRVPEMGALPSSRHRMAAGAFLLLGLLGLAFRFLGTSVQGPSSILARTGYLLGSVACLWVAWSLLRDERRGRIAGIVASVAFLVLSVPVLVTGSAVSAISLAAISIVLLYLLWDKALRPIVLPLVILAVLSLSVGLLYAFYQAVLLREALLYLIFLQGIEPVSSLFTFLFRPGEAVSTVDKARVFEARQSIRFFSSYILFLFIMLILSAVSLAYKLITQARSRGRTVAYATAVLGIVLAGYLVFQTNVRPVQADMIFKRGRPFDVQATSQQQDAPWDVAIAIYEEALDIAPFEDYYHLFLGRALLERSSVSEDEDERAVLLDIAEQRLLEARALNPLNTDHSANLARLKAREALTGDDPQLREQLIDESIAYYQDALSLSPQNSIIRNEFARLAFDLGRDCDSAVSTFQDSLAIDPFYTDTYFAFADTLTACAAAQSDETNQRAYYETAVEVLEAGLTRKPKQQRAWLQAGQIYQRLLRYEQALAAFKQARILADQSQQPTWNVDYLQADLLREMGDIDNARALAEQALQTAPTDVADQIQTFLTGLEE